MAVENVAEATEVYDPGVEELDDSDQILRSPDPQRYGDQVLGPQDARPDAPLQFVDPDLDLLRLLQRLGIEIVSNGQKLYGPAFDEKSFFSIFGVSLRLQVRK